MNRSERIENYIKQYYSETKNIKEASGLTAGSIAQKLGLHRSDVSAILNTLSKNGKLQKKGRKPVRFFLYNQTIDSSQNISNKTYSQNTSNSPTFPLSLKTTEQNVPTPPPFSAVIGASGSISAQIQLAKAAVSYPPNGLHTLIIGESGVGKSFLAEEMWRYAKVRQKNSLQTIPPFVLFSCADYADNPQLLLSQLFGYMKGSFSGATDNKPGLVERAEGGILFLDEIHRLPSVGQELLFTLLDKNIYRRLGETSDRQCHLMVIAATTESPSDVLLNTFLRRIPVVIQLPTLEERPSIERFGLIKHFFTLESHRLRIPIRISSKALQSLASYKCTANIGSLKNDITLACAEAYLSYLNSSAQNSKILSVNIQDLPQRVYSTAQPLKAVTELYSQELYIYPNASKFQCSHTSPGDLHSYTQARIKNHATAYLHQNSVEDAIGQELKYYYHIASSPLQKNNITNTFDCPSIISPKVWIATTFIIDKATHHLKRNYSYGLCVALAMHLQQFTGRIKAGQIIYNPNLASIKTRHSVELTLIKNLSSEIETCLNTEFPEDEAGFVAMFLTQQINVETKKYVGLIIASHGNSIASGMAEIANQIFSTNLVYPLNVTLGCTVNDLFEKLCLLVKEVDQGKGVLVLSDIDTLMFMEKDILEKTSVLCRVIPRVSTALLLEASKLVLISDASLNSLADIVAINYKEYANFICNTVAKANYPTCSASDKRNRELILTVSPSGIGAATKIRDIVKERIPLAKTMKIIPLGSMNEVQGFVTKFQDRIKLIIGGIDPKLQNIPFIEMSKVLTNQGLNEIEIILKGWNKITPPLLSNTQELSLEESLALINSKISFLAPSLDPGETICQSRYVLCEIEHSLYHKPLPRPLAARIYIHIICMFERLSTGDTLALSETTELVIRERQDEFNFLYSVTTSAAYRLKIKITEAEVAYLLIILPQQQVSKDP